MFPETPAEVRRVFKTTFESGFADGFIKVGEQVHGMVQSFFHQPFSWRGLVNALEVSFKCRQTSCTELCKFFHLQVEAEVFFHYLLQGYGLGIFQ